MKIALTNGDIYQFSNSKAIQKLLGTTGLSFKTNYALFILAKKMQESLEAKAFYEAQANIISRHAIRDEHGKTVRIYTESGSRIKFDDDNALIEELNNLYETSSSLEIDPIVLTMEDCQAAGFTPNDLLVLSSLKFFEIENV